MRFWQVSTSLRWVSAQGFLRLKHTYTGLVSSLNPGTASIIYEEAVSTENELWAFTLKVLTIFFLKFKFSRSWWNWFNKVRNRSADCSTVIFWQQLFSSVIKWENQFEKSNSTMLSILEILELEWILQMLWDRKYYHQIFPLWNIIKSAIFWMFSLLPSCLHEAPLGANISIVPSLWHVLFYGHWKVVKCPFA